jgi:hypothetical protein
VLAGETGSKPALGSHPYPHRHPHRQSHVICPKRPECALRLHQSSCLLRTARSGRFLFFV